MSETPNLSLPLVASAQAQKHVTVNEALARIDAALQLNIVSRALSDAPASVAGEVYLVAPGATGNWTGQDGALAFAVGEGWDFVAPQAGWRVWVADEAVWISFDGLAWGTGVLATTSSGSEMRGEVIEVDVALSAEGAVVVTTAIIPTSSLVFAVTGRVISGFDGTLSDWSLGVSGSDNRYGSGLGNAAGSFVHGMTGQPQAYYSDTPLTMTANGGDFGTGVIRLAIHMMRFEIPRA